MFVTVTAHNATSTQCHCYWPPRASRSQSESLQLQPMWRRRRLEELSPHEASQSSRSTVCGFSTSLLKVAWLIMADLDWKRYVRDIKLECFWECFSRDSGHTRFWGWWETASVKNLGQTYTHSFGDLLVERANGHHTTGQRAAAASLPIGLMMSQQVLCFNSDLLKHHWLARVHKQSVLAIFHYWMNPVVKLHFPSHVSSLWICSLWTSKVWRLLYILIIALFFKLIQ